MRAPLCTLAVLVVFLVGITQSVDRNNFKTCEQSSFCRRCRKVQPDNSPFQVVPGSLNTYSDSVTAELVNTENDYRFLLKVAALKDNTFHVVIDEKQPLRPRYRVQDALKGPVQSDTIKVTEKSDTEIVLSVGLNRAIIHAQPFRIDFYQNDVLTVSANAKGLMRFEHLRTKATPVLDEEGNAIVAPEDNRPKSIEDEDPGSWDENYKSHHDSKPNGPQAIALDFSFPEARVLFGIPEHAESFALKSTVGKEPYRLYNLDVFEYELDNGMALYGSVPVIYGHGPDRTAGVYWQNAAETWVDIYNPETEGNVLKSLVNLVSGSDKHPLTANFMSESGIVDAFILMGPRPNDVFKQYTDLTGVVPLPQLFALGYHQCRWNYNDERDVDTVSNTFDQYDIPMDTMWLDIEYTDSKKYFTWDQHKFANSVDMIHNLTALGRHLTVIIDPHIKRDSNYFFHNDCQDRGYYTKNKDGNDYEGWCWPGAASYPDLFNPEVRKYFADQYAVDKFAGTTTDVMIWNDMNEPSVFNGPEVTMLKDNLHFGGWEHRDVHNLYGHMQLMSTYDGLGRRDNWQQRPFILTRAHFAGSQRLATIWTGDNAAEWSHLQASIKMCLSESVAGFSFCGADVGGFFGNPDAELLGRWYQTGAFQPFFRAHAHIDTKRREPWLFPEATRLIIRDAIRKRYSFLSLWYTLFYEHERFGLPVMRPLLSAYPTDVNTFALDDQFLIGDVLLVRPVMEAGATSVSVYFPLNAQNKPDIWYDIDNHQAISTAGRQTISVDSHKIPVYQRGGTILPKKERIRRAATLMKDDPYTLNVALDSAGKARGSLYLDDEKSFEYRIGKYVYLSLDFADGVLRSERVDATADYASRSWLERVRIVGLTRVPTSATLKTKGSETPVKLDVWVEQGAVVVRKPGVSIREEWTITLDY